MAKQAVTVAIEAAILKKARAMSACRGLSVSAFLAESLRELVDREARYGVARKRALALLSTPLPLGGTTLPREGLHGRRSTR